MKQPTHICVHDAYLGAEILHSNTKCRKGIYKVIFAGAEKLSFGCQWRITFILSYVCFSDHDLDPCCQSAFAANMVVVAEPGQNIRFERYLGILGKETISYDGDYKLSDRFYPVQCIKLLDIQTDHIRYEIHHS